jgi:lysophospholipase L1-like esterase
MNERRSADPPTSKAKDMNLKRRHCVLLSWSLLLAVPALAEVSGNSSFALRDGDRVVFYGDSITAQRLYTRFAEDMVVSRYPKLRIQFYNAGVSGDTVSGGHSGDMDTRLKRDVLPFHPTVVTIMLGMNDGRYTKEYEGNFKVYAEGYRKLIAGLREALPGVRLYLICPSPYDEIAHSPQVAGYNSVMIRYGQFVSELGKEQKIPVVDFNWPMTSAEERGVKVDRALAGSLQPDRIHPSPAGHWIMAAALVQGWNLDPTVSSVTIDAKQARAGEEHNTFVRELRVASDKISWTQLDEALPLPLELNDPIAQFLLQVSDLAQLDRQMLRVTGLTAPTYTLFIDDKKIASFTGKELNDGVNLALYQTPMEDQAKSIDWAADDRTRLSGTRFGLLTEEGIEQTAALESLDELDLRMIDGEYKNAQPKPHAFELALGEK